MKLLTPPWKTAWYDDQISERFFQEMARLEKTTIPELETSARWLNQLVIEVGQLAQHMSNLEGAAPQATQVKLAYERALRLAALAAHLCTSLDRADPVRIHTPVGQQQSRNGHLAVRSMAPAPAIAEQSEAEPQAADIPLRQTVTGLSRRGLSVAEIEVITGRSRSQIEAVLGRR